MKVISNIHEFQTLRRELNVSIGFVATMGCLHAGHASLIERSVRDNTHTILSIFVNPTQFNNSADLHNYPKTLEADLELAKTLGVDCVLIPDRDQMYPDAYHFRVTTQDPLSQLYEGEYRPGHYDGVLSVVMKLFHIVRPHTAYFGEKDLQQFLLIQRMAAAFFMDIKIVSCPTVREASGLALSSRNTRLNAEQKQRAEFFAQTLQSHRDIETIKKILTEQHIKIDYIEHYQNYVLAAVHIDDIRLIDAVTIHPNS